MDLHNPFSDSASHPSINSSDICRHFHLLQPLHRPPVDGSARRLFLHFRRSPAAVLADKHGHLRGLSLERMELQGREGEGRGQLAIGTGHFEILPARFLKILEKTYITLL